MDVLAPIRTIGANRRYLPDGHPPRGRFRRDRGGAVRAAGRQPSQPVRMVVVHDAAKKAPKELYLRWWRAYFEAARPGLPFPPTTGACWSQYVAARKRPRAKRNSNAPRAHSGNGDKPRFLHSGRKLAGISGYTAPVLSPNGRTAIFFEHLRDSRQPRLARARQIPARALDPPKPPSRPQDGRCRSSPSGTSGGGMTIGRRHSGLHHSTHLGAVVAAGPDPF